MVGTHDVPHLPAIGSHVRVPWGLGDADGEVVDAYDSGIGGQVKVAVHIEGTEDPLTVTFPADVVVQAQAA